LPSFIISKKNNNICFLSNFWEVNNRLVRKPFLIPKISTVLQVISTWVITPLDWIQMHPKSVKYSYKQLPMGIVGSPDT
jgi:hypothetical protein